MGLAAERRPIPEGGVKIKTITKLKICALPAEGSQMNSISTVRPPSPPTNNRKNPESSPAGRPSHCTRDTFPKLWYAGILLICSFRVSGGIQSDTLTVCLSDRPQSCWGKQRYNTQPTNKGRSNTYFRLDRALAPVDHQWRT